MNEPISGVLDRLNHDRMTVPGAAHGNAGGEIQEAIAVHVPHLRPLAVGHHEGVIAGIGGRDHQRIARQQLARLRARQIGLDMRSFHGLNSPPLRPYDIATAAIFRYDSADAIRQRLHPSRSLVKAPGQPPLLGFWMCVALVVGNTIGASVFLLPASLAPFGLNSVIAWGFTACGALVLAVVFAQLSRAFPQAGGPYAYVKLAFGPFTAFIVAWGYWISIWVGNAAIATGAVSYLSPLLPWIATVPGASAAVTLLMLWLLTFVNCYGIKASGWVQGVTAVLKVLPLIAISGLGLWSVRAATVTAAAGIPLSVSGTTAAATLTLFALLGLESATIPASKVRDPG